jgi:hypothetical protein
MKIKLKNIILNKLRLNDELKTNKTSTKVLRQKIRKKKKKN